MNKPSSYEEKIIKILLKEKIDFKREKSFPDLRGGLFRYDFYLPSYNGVPVIIEVDGEYHFKEIRGRRALLGQQERDRKKNNYCLANKIPLYRIPYWEIKNINSSNEIFKEEFLVKSMWHNDRLSRKKLDMIQ